MINITALVLFSALFLEVLVNSIFSPGFWPLFAVFGLTLLAAILLWHKDPASRRQIDAFLAAVRGLKHKCLLLFVLMLSLQVYLGYALMVVPSSWDMYAVWKSAVSLATTGTFPQSYFAMYPNNTALMLILTAYVLLVKGLFGEITVLSAVILNHIVIDLSVILLCRTARRLWGPSAAGVCMLLCFLSSPFYLYIPIFYTDTFSLLPMLAALNLYILAGKCARKSGQAALYLLCGVLTALASLIKGSMVIMLIALLLYSLFKFKPLKSIAVLLCVAVGFGAAYFSYTAALKQSDLIPAELSEEYRFPYTHWIMMGLSGAGNFNAADRNFTASFPTLEAKQAAVAAEIKNRLNRLGWQGLLLQANRKASQYAWNFGTFKAERYLGDTGDLPVQYSWLHDYVLSEGFGHAAFYGLTQNSYILVFLSMVLSMLLAVKKKPKGYMTLLQITLIGALLFFMIWETHPRYILNFYPFMILLATSFLTDQYRRVTGQLPAGLDI